MTEPTLTDNKKENEMFNTQVGSNQACVPSKESGFNLAMSELNNRVDVLTSRLENLYHRIEPFISPEHPTKGVNNQPSSPKPEAIGRIDSVSERISELTNTIDECISRLEI